MGAGQIDSLPTRKETNVPYNNVHDYASAQAWLAGGRDKRCRPLENNTRLIQHYNGDIEVRLHYTAVVTYHPNGLVTLSTGGWDTVTTWSRIRSYSPFGNFQTVRHKGRSYHVMPERNVPLFPPNLKKCGKCHGKLVFTARGWHHDENGTWSQIARPDTPCDRCHGTGTVDYGSQPDYIIFRDGIRINRYGEVIGKRNEERLSRVGRRAERQKRAAQRASAKAIKDATIISDGKAVYYKAVSLDFESPIQDGACRYYLGQTVEADGLNPDPRESCSNGINFCASVEDALCWHGWGHVVIVTVPKGETIIKSESRKLRALRVRVVGIIPYNELH